MHPMHVGGEGGPAGATLCSPGMEVTSRGPVSSCRLLTVHRELLVHQVKNVQCILDNFQRSGLFCSEDVEIVLRTSTRPDQVFHTCIPCAHTGR